MSRDSARRYLIAYDIADDRRRAHLAHRLSSYGDRIQFSVFVVDTRPAKFVRLRAVLERMIDPQTDSVLICDLGLLAATDARFDVIGRSRPLTDADSLII